MTNRIEINQYVKLISFSVKVSKKKLAENFLRLVRLIRKLSQFFNFEVKHVTTNMYVMVFISKHSNSYLCELGTIKLQQNKINKK